MRIDPERQVAQDLRSNSIPQADMLETDHVPLRASSTRRNPWKTGVPSVEPQ
jgi:hypothetical protein